MARDFRQPYQDFAGEPSTFSTTLLAAAGDGALTTLFNATEGLTVDGSQLSFTLDRVDKDGANSGKATDPLAQRENKWLVIYIGQTSGNTFTREMPNADLTELTGNQDSLDLTAGNAATFVAAFEAVATGLLDEAVVIDEIRFVARNI